MTVNTRLNPDFDVTELLSGLPEGSVVIDLSCSDHRIFCENVNRVVQLKEDASEAHVYPIWIPGSAKPLMDPSPSFGEARYVLIEQIKTLAGDSQSVVVCVTIHELCKAYAYLKLDRKTLNERMLKEVEQLPYYLTKMLGNVLKGILVFKVSLDEEGKEADSTQFVGGMSVMGV